MNSDYKRNLSSNIEAKYIKLEQDILNDIVRRIVMTGRITSTADWQINRLKILGNSTEDIEKMIKDALNASYPEMFELYDQVINWEYVRDADLYEQVNAEFIPYEDNKEMQQLVNAYTKQSYDELGNITRSLGFYMDNGQGKQVFTELSKVYTNILDDTVLRITSGAFDYNSALHKAVTDLTNSGLRTIDYVSGRTSRVEVAARRAVMTGVSQLTGNISEMNAEKLGTNHFEIAWHANARTGSGVANHQAWQGKVYSKEELVTKCGLGSIVGLLGINCYHEYYPFIPGISERNWTDKWLEEENAKENTKVEFKGKEYTNYEATQRQRQMEVAMRAQREKVSLLKAGGANSEDITIAQAKYMAQLDEYGQFSRAMDLLEKRDRIYIDGLGRIATSNSNLEKYKKGLLHSSKERVLPEKLEAVYNGEKILIPSKSVVKNVKTIAQSEEIRDVKRLVALYGGEESDWKKQVGTIESDKYKFDIHWYEKNKELVDVKIKSKRGK